MNDVRDRLRTGDWWSSKIPPLVAVAYAGILLANVDWRIALPVLAKLLAAIVAVAGYGYVLNDAFDIEEDRKRGKANSMAALAPWQRAGMLLALATAALVLGGFLGKATRLLIVLNLALPTLYSVPPVRLKERGVLGALADAMGVHAVPTLIFAASILPLGDRSAGWRATAFMTTATVWGLVTGFRGIIVHQLMDRESDLDAGVKTFAGGMDSGSARRIVFRLLLPAELASLFLLVLVIVPVAPVLLFAIPTYLFFELLKVLDNWKLPIVEPDFSRGKPYVPLEHNDLYELWLPLSLGIQLAASALPFAALPALHLLAFLPSTRRRFAELAGLTPVIRWFVTGNGRPPLCIAPYSESDASAQGFASRSTSNGVRVFVGAARWRLNGVNLFSANLVRGLRGRGLEASVLLTDGELGAPGRNDAAPLSDVPVIELPQTYDSRWSSNTIALIRFLEHQAPCVFVPNGDRRAARILPLLSDKVGIANVAHYEADRLSDQYPKVFAAKERIGERTYFRSGGLLGRVKAFVHLVPDTGKRPPHEVGSPS